MIKLPKIPNILSNLGITWRQAFIVYKDNDTYLYSVKEETCTTTYTFTDNYRNCKVFENFEEAYSWICIYNYSSWAIDNTTNPDDKEHKLFAMPIEIKGNGKNLKRRMIPKEPLYDSNLTTPAYT